MASTGNDVGAGLHPDMEKTASRRSHSNTVPDELLASDADAELLGPPFCCPFKSRNG